MLQREELDRFVMVFPRDEPRGYRFVRVRSEESLAEERFAREVMALKVNRSEKRAAEPPLPIVRESFLQPGHGLSSAERRNLKERQASLFGSEPEVRPDGRRA